MRRGMPALITELEQSTLSPGYWIATFLAIVALRNLLEGALGPSGSIGFTHFASPSALMVLDHFLFFYVSLFLALSVVLAALAHERIGRVMKVMTPAWAILLIPPFLDYLATSGEGMKITYIPDLSFTMLRLFDPRVSFERISPGQRVEVLAACLLALAYVRIKTRRWPKAIAGFVAVYLVLAAHGILPAAFARLAGLGLAAKGATSDLLYQAAYKSGGIVPDESRKLALLFLFTSCLLGWAVFRIHAPGKARAMLRNLRPIRSLHYLAMAIFGIAFAWALVLPCGVGVSGGGDLLGILGICLATFLAFQGSVAMNDLFDEEGDRLVGAARPLVTGALTRGDVVAQAVVCSLGAMVVALNVKYSTFLLMVLALAISLLYSAPPLRLKRVPIVATLLLGVASLLLALVGFSAFAEERALAIFPARLGWVIVLSFGLGFAAKDLKDVEGDRATGVLTLPVLLGERRGKAAVAALLVLGYLVVPLLLPFRLLALPAALLGAWSAAMVFLWKRPRLDEILLAVSLVFTAVVGITALKGIDRLLDGRAPAVQATALEFHGRRAEAWHDWPRAAESYAQAAQILTNDADVQARAGATLHQSGRFEESLPILARAVELDPSAPLNREYLAVSESRLGLAESAEEHFRAAIRENLQPRVFYSLLAEHYMAKRDPASAATAFARSLRLGQPDIPARMRLADALAQCGRAGEARTQYETAAARRPSSAEAHDALGRFYHLEGMLDPAIGEMRTAVKLAPQDPAYWNNLGTAYRSKGLFDDAMSALAEATRLAPRMADPYWNRGEIFRTVGREEEARRQYLLALEIDPDFAPARAALTQEPPPNQ